MTSLTDSENVNGMFNLDLNDVCALSVRVSEPILPMQDDCGCLMSFSDKTNPEIAPASRAMVVLCENCRFCVGRTPSGGLMIKAIHLSTDRAIWQLRLLVEQETGGWHWIEHGCGAAGQITLEIPGRDFYTHRQLDLECTPIEQAAGRFGCFTQHGQLLDFKDWFAVGQDESALGILCPRPGHWTQPAKTLGTIKAEQHQLTMALPIPSGLSFRRHFLLATTTRSELMQNDCLGLMGFERDPAVGHTRWAPHLIARHGVGQPHRLNRIHQLVHQQHWQQPTQPAICSAAELTQAKASVSTNPSLAPNNPYWSGQTTQAIEHLFTWLEDALTSLKDKAYLHPKGNPVYLRPLASLMVMYNLLDFDGKLTDEQRTHGASLIAQLATLLMRRDFYPWDLAMLDDADPRSIHHLYRGMLNQNFNTDRFVAVGMAGCVLASHPHARRWRQHAIEQFKLQMKSFVYPDGCWEESHTYANHVKLTLLPLGVALKRCEEAFDMFADPDFAAMCRFFVHLLSPRQTDMEHCRLIPAIGDHGYTHHDYSFLFGWLSSVFPNESDLYHWAWEQGGRGDVEARSLQQTMFQPLLCPVGSQTPSPIKTPEFKVYPGFGACARQGFGTDHESMLLIRCGRAWGHYHPDQGSFWWWSNNELICADAMLGKGELKFAHQGHNVLGYVDHHPMQHLDRTPYDITDAQADEDGQCKVTCHLPIERWQRDARTPIDIPKTEQPINTREFHWQSTDHLIISDQPVRSPNQQITWSLHVLADKVQRVADDRFEFCLSHSQRFLTLQCPAIPFRVVEHHQSPTLGLTLFYNEQDMIHHLNIGKKSS
jgi:hypothetical protein